MNHHWKRFPLSRKIHHKASKFTMVIRSRCKVEKWHEKRVKHNFPIGLKRHKYLYLLSAAIKLFCLDDLQPSCYLHSRTRKMAWKCSGSRVQKMAKELSSHRMKSVTLFVDGFMWEKKESRTMFVETTLEYDVCKYVCRAMLVFLWLKLSEMKIVVWWCCAKLQTKKYLNLLHQKLLCRTFISR